ncbi:hypothetical protein [Oleidesulfovibrio sp.]|uniref:hypothetical protein n=1 Tax=Oleidesulfovibrio sp. TaxID=2909707 RepID=UPI003A8B5FC3
MKQYIPPLLNFNVTKHFPPGRMYILPLVRVPRGPLWDPPYLPAPYSPLLSDAKAIVNDTVSDIQTAHQAGFSKRVKQGQMPPHSGPLTRPTPASSPELYTGRLVDTSL